MSDKQEETKKQNVQADDQSIAIGSIDVGGDISENITIGHTIGYTADEVSTLIEQITSTFQPKPFDGRCPYKGLDVFEEQDAELFFGRKKIVGELVERVKGSRTMFITGPSGSGKSSLVRAGLIPALRQGGLKNSEHWLYETVKPGRDPHEALALAFSRLKSPELGKYFRENVHQSNVLYECAESALSSQKDQRLVLFFDQFEEVFTQVSQEDRRATFLKLLTHAATVEDGRVIILFAMRSDFVSNCATYSKLNALLNQQFLQVGAMGPGELVSAIAQPALQVGLRIDPDLIAQIITDMQGEPGALPLMQFALKDLFEAEQAKGGIIALTREAYLQRGGIQKSLERHADASFEKLEKHEQELARSIFSGLIEIGRGNQDTRRTALFDELVPSNSSAEEVTVILQKLGDARLVTTEEEDNKYTITHERLIDAWPWLKRLVNDNRDKIALQNQIATDAKEWEEHNHDASYLYRGARLSNAREKIESKTIALSELAELFVETGVKAYADELDATKQRAIQLRNRSIFLTAALMIALIAVGIAVSFGFQSREQAKNALVRQLAAQAQNTYATGVSNQMISVLLAIQSMKLDTNAEAAQILRDNKLSSYLYNINSGNYYMDGPENRHTVAFSPDGKYVVSVGCDVLKELHCEKGFASVWEIETGQEIAHMTHDDSVISVAFSPDGKYVVTGSNDNTARVWGVTTGEEVARTTYNYGVTSVAFSPDGKYVVSVGCDVYDELFVCKKGFASVWEIETGQEIAHMTHDDSVISVAFSPDGKYVVTGSNDNTARVWETITGQEVARMTHDYLVKLVAFSPDGKYVVSSGSLYEDNTARVWETITGQEVARMYHDGFVTSVAFSPDSKYIVTGSTDGSARVWKISTREEVARTTHDFSVNSVAFSPDGKYVVSGSNDNTARVWEATTGKEIAIMLHDISVKIVAFSPDGKYILSADSNGNLRVWKDYVTPSISNDDQVTSLAFSPDGKYIVSGGCIFDCDKGVVNVWDAITGNKISSLNLEGSVSSVAFSPDGKDIASAGFSHKSGRDNGIVIWDFNSNNENIRIPSQWTRSIAFSSDGKLLASASDFRAEIWDVSTATSIGGFRIGDGFSNIYYTSVAFSPDNQYVVYGTDDGRAVVFDVDTKEKVIEMKPWTRKVYSVAFSPNGKYVIWGGCDRTPLGDCSKGVVRVETISSSSEVSHMNHNDYVSSVAISPDGKYVVSGSCEIINLLSGSCSKGIARVWEIDTGKEVDNITHDDYVTSVAFSPDGKYVVSGSIDGSIRLWSWRPDDLITKSCASITRNLNREEWKQYMGDLPYQAICPNLPVDSSPGALPSNYYTLISLWPITFYIIYGWFAYRTITSEIKSDTLPNSLGFTWKRFLISGGQGGLLVFLSFVGLIIVYILINLNVYSDEFQASQYPYGIIFLLPSGLWAGGVYSHFTRFQSGKLAKIKRVFLGGLAGFLGAFVFSFLTMMLLAITLQGAELGDILTWIIVLILSITLGGIVGILSSFGTLIYIFGVQKLMMKFVAQNKFS